MLPETPLVSVVIATRNRSELLKVGIHSVLNQTFKDFELVVVDDGSTDNTELVVKGIDDPRVVYVRGKGEGISAARNIGAQKSRGQWTAVHDDDDIMLPNRLEEQLKFVDDSVDFIYGAFMNFDDETGELQLHHGRNYGYAAALMSGFAPGHSTWLVRTELLQTFQYDEGIESAVDNNITFRMLRSGVRFKHSGVFCLLRRVHSGRITDQGGQGQKYVAQMNLSFLKRAFTQQSIQELSKAARRDWGPVDKTNWETKYLGFLPDHLVKRSGFVVIANEDPELKESFQRLEVLDAAEMNWAEFFASCGAGAKTNRVSVRLRENSEIEKILNGIELAKPNSKKSPQDLITEYALASIHNRKDGFFDNAEVVVLAVGPAPAWTDEQKSVTKQRFSTTENGTEVMGGIIPLHSLDAAEGIRNALFGDGVLDCRVFVNGTSDKVREMTQNELHSDAMNKTA
ncbi:hypothetical protein CQ019_17990 [Arthrobacter sp. MYb229]|uniref:glycosyltransferase family 2 protein n=1 Tax=unclassified Arthrobacter TaxID=235627 RepID=UPI000CFC2FDA|nr:MULTISPECIES: glycosyltransferase family 2 protein [unclassified Arthrobacter]PQZ97423.1 hypothetical protein CQ019_17990 [Arthrobacter sp. MYb229]PRB46388.1 hypothetical protein CQ013_18030 [Arthrobacter sp. MYb216]